MSQSTPYLHITCDTFSLLLNTANILEIIKLKPEQSQSEIHWRHESLNSINLNAILNPNTKLSPNQNALILELDEGEHIAITVGSVASIEALRESSFRDLPSLQFNYNQYFDKAYIHPESQQCIYRLKLSAFSGSTENQNPDTTSS